MTTEHATFDPTREPCREREWQFGAMAEADGQVAVFRRPRIRQASPSHPESYHANPGFGRAARLVGTRAGLMHFPSILGPPMRFL